ncbi:ABC transporter substrate-binding protein [Deferribacter abyssi]|uniref:ABC transporter substrate-binding protein n=1 Tax=Deferribacter abyssi TaxID=213806 RepID=UPI003C156CDE
MRYKVKLCLLFFFVFVEISYSKEILLVISYHKDFPWVKDFEKGFFEVITEKRVEKFYLNSKHGSNIEIANNVTKAVKIIEKQSPKILVCLDDNAFEFVCKKYFNTDKQIVFAGINRDRSYYNLEKVSNVTGVFEHIYFEQTFEIIKDAFPAAKNILLLSDKSASSLSALEKCPKKYKGLHITIKNIENFTDWQEEITKAQGIYDILIILTCAKIKDNKGRYLLNTDVLSWTLKNNRLPEITLLNWMVQKGALMGVTISGYYHGIEAGTIVQKLLNGFPISKIPYIKYTKAELTVNLKRAKELNIQLPIGILMFANTIN